MCVVVLVVGLRVGEIVSLLFEDVTTVGIFVFVVGV